MHCHKRPQKNEFENARQLKPCMFLVFFFGGVYIKRETNMIFLVFFIQPYVHKKIWQPF